MTNVTDLPACREAYHRHLDDLGYKAHEVVYSDVGYRDHTIELRWQGFKAAWNRIDHPEGGEAVADELQGAFAECYVSENGMKALHSEAECAFVHRAKNDYATIPLFTHPPTPSVDVETLKALVERWRLLARIDPMEDDGYCNGEADTRDTCADELEAAIKRGERES